MRIILSGTCTYVKYKTPMILNIWGQLIQLSDKGLKLQFVRVYDKGSIFQSACSISCTNIPLHFI